MLLAMISVPNTSMVDVRLGRISPNMIRTEPMPWATADSHELLLAQREHLPAHGAAEVWDVDDPDHEVGIQSDPPSIVKRPKS